MIFLIAAEMVLAFDVSLRQVRLKILISKIREYF